MSTLLPIGRGTGLLCVAVLAMVCTLVSSSFSSTAAGAFSFLALAAALAGFVSVSVSFLRGSTG